MPSLADRPWRQAGALFLAAQGIGTVAWWIGLYNSGAIRSAFVPTDAGWEAVRNLVIPDVVVFGGLSLLAAVLLWNDHRHAKASLIAITGAATYATAVAWSWLAAPVSHWVGAAVMTLSLVFTSAITAIAHQAGANHG